MFKTKYRAVVRDGDPCTRCLNPIKSLKLHSYNSRNRGIHADCMAHQIELLRRARKVKKAKHRGKILDGDPCRICFRPIVCVATDAYATQPGAHKSCFTAHNEAATKKRMAAESPAEQRLSWWKVTRSQAQWRSRKRGYTDFNLLADKPLSMPQFCPVLGMELDYSRTGERTASSASIDQIEPGGGYTYTNSAVVSWRANNLKSDASVKELTLVLSWMIRMGVK